MLVVSSGGGALATGQSPDLNVRLPVITAGAETRGGVHADAQIIVVSSLNDSGPGSLREAISARGPRVIVFTVGGAIWLRDDLQISEPYVTIAGQTAPSPGISVFGGKLRIRANNVVVQHISVRPGGSVDMEDNQAGDAITIHGCDDCRQPTQDIRLENISAGWATDEVIGSWGRTLSRVTIRNSIIAEGLSQAGHPKGEHSKGLLIGQYAQGFVVAGNLFANNFRRNPVISSGASAIVVNNLIYNPGRAAIHLYRGLAVRASIIGNVVIAGPNSKRDLSAVEAPDSFLERTPGSIIFASDNICCEAGVRNSVQQTVDFAVARHAPVVTGAWQQIASAGVEAWVTRYAGKRPGERDPIDARLVEQMRKNTGQIINRPEDSGGPLALTAAYSEVELPAEPFALAANTGGLRNIEVWLCQLHFKVGGPPTPECPAGLAALVRD